MIAIPDHLEHLRRDRRGLPVPYINLWGEEDPARLAVRHDENVGREGLFLDDDEETVPDFTRQNFGRQRECMLKGLCQVCGHQVPGVERVIPIADISAHRIEIDGRPHVALSEPWLCDRCALFALEVCPALIRRGRAGQLKLRRVPMVSSVTFSVSTGWVEGPLEAHTKANPAAMWVKVLLPELVTR